MSQGRHSIYHIVPPYVLKHLQRIGDASAKQGLQDTLSVDKQIRDQRHDRQEQVISSSITIPGSTVTITVYDANHASSESDLPGTEITSGTLYSTVVDSLEAVYDFYQEFYSRNSIDDKGLPLKASIHFMQNYDNAFWNGTEMVFGDGDGTQFVTDCFVNSLDVIGHELTHGVTQDTVDLEYHDQPGALNESISDVFGSMIKQFKLQQTAETADWMIGQNIMIINGQKYSLRSMENPGTAYPGDPQPADMAHYVQLPDDDDDDDGGVHYNSGIPNRAFCLAAKQIGGQTWLKAGLVWYKTLDPGNDSLLTGIAPLQTGASFQDFATRTIAVAGALFGADGPEASAIQSAWKTVGVIS